MEYDTADHFTQAHGPSSSKRELTAAYATYAVMGLTANRSRARHRTLQRVPCPIYHLEIESVRNALDELFMVFGNASSNLLEWHRSEVIWDGGVS